MDIKILFEDESLIVIDKPAGLVVNRSETSGEETIQDWIEKRKKINRLKGQKVKDSTFQPDNLFTFLQRSGIVHRLDKETSGCLMIAKTPEAFVELQRQFKVRDVQKEYVALVHGHVKPAEGTIRVPLGRSRENRQKFAVVPGGRMAETGYKVTQIFKGLAFGAKGQAFSSSVSQFTLLRLFPRTGRTHQIRVHMKYFGHPIVADETYAGDDRAREDRTWCPRLFLHAAKIGFIHPQGKRVLVEAPLPADLSLALGTLKQVQYASHD